MSRSDVSTAKPRRVWLRNALGLGLIVSVAGGMSGCHDSMRQLGEACRLATDLRIQLNQASGASIRAVMATTTEASTGFAHEAAQARRIMRNDAEDLRPLLRELGYVSEIHLLAEFNRHFAEYEALDRTILDLAVEDTNLKAQKLSYGPTREAADAFRAALEAAAGAASPKNRCQADALVAKATLAVREIQVLHAPHISESSDAVMDALEKQMSERLTAAYDALNELPSLIEPPARGQLALGKDSLARFKVLHDQILVLSRRNSNVRSLELAVGQARVLTAACDASIRDLQNALANEGVHATR